MKQEELKVALCGYYPHGVFGIRFEEEKPLELIGIDGERLILRMSRFPYRTYSFYNEFKPVLYNISTLTKPIIVKGYNGGLPFVPMKELAAIKRVKNPLQWLSTPTIEESDAAYEFSILAYTIDEGLIPMWMQDLFNRWKIDFRNLIGQGLAIDVETLKENCYE